MVISDLAWTQNDMLIIVGFSANYFSIISRFGHLVKIVKPEEAIPRSFLVYNSIQTSPCNRIHISAVLNHYYYLNIEQSVILWAEWSSRIQNRKYSFRFGSLLHVGRVLQINQPDKAD